MSKVFEGLERPDPVLETSTAEPEQFPVQERQREEPPNGVPESAEHLDPNAGTLTADDPEHVPDTLQE